MLTPLPFAPPPVRTPATGTRTVELLEDGGAAAADAHFFRSGSYLRAEEVTHTLTLRADDGWAAVPLVVRPIDGTGLRDARSPYGYPGGRRGGAQLTITPSDLARTGLVSIFLRERAVVGTFRGGRPGGRIHLHDPMIDRSVGKSFRRAVRRLEGAGFVATLVDGTDVSAELLAAFREVYLQTMRRRGAAPRFLHDLGYLRLCLDSADTWLTCVHSPDGRLAAADLLVRSDDVLHSFLFGTADEFCADSPGKVATIRAMDLADTLRIPFNVGGGLTPGDGVEQSKRQYCNVVSEFRCHEIICDPDAYHSLPAAAGRDGFFPRYRAPALVATGAAPAGG
ncbi:MAG: GNAT family N-acetyltransferase [Pseudonocardia sp.]|nr:GNAT family N-acetyltransferase [Pseudonocardia sp.]